MLYLNALKKVYASRGYFILSIISLLIVLFLYYLAIETSASWFIFTNANKPLYVVLQILLSVINAILIAISISFFIYILKDKKIKGEANFLETIATLIFSVGTTGCYVCGSILLPSLSLGASFLTLPLGGLEIKFLTILLSIYTIRQYSLNILGLCKIPRIKNYKLNFENINLKFSNKNFQNIKPLMIFIGFSFVVLALPMITKELNIKRSFAQSNFVCELEK